ncbi:MAG: two-component system, response regulator, stage 0 sporulation protein [Acidobacteriota bacterium]|jgi:two-component system response regulator YesN|nr:two-component system, response regulator, stage 0 sporulation protein [Acidobacteriota bacterium]
MASILIVDDDEVIRTTLLDLFSERYLCHTAGTAEGALKLFEAQNYDVIITDISMPGMSGEDLLGFAKKYQPRTRVIFISGLDDRQNAERLLVKGAVGYLSKPFRLEEIEEKVTRAIESH